jgi:methylenetetrahydrofolate reductase (NADPH)
MKIADLLMQKKTLSFEVFPPKEGKSLDPLLETLSRLYDLGPDFISCTYGAGGTNKGRSVEICARVKESGVEILTHMTCIGNTRGEIKNYIAEYRSFGVENVLALRGDLPRGWEGTGGDFGHGDDLVAFLQGEFPELCLAAAGYPEKHLDAPSFAEDVVHLRSKQDRGARFIITQLCHDVDAYSRYMERIRRAGVRIPVIAGIMPVLSREVILRITVSNGCSIPAELASLIGKYGDDPESFKKAGMAYTAAQIRRYLKEDLAGLHLYTLNKWEDIAGIVGAAGLGGRV